MAIDDSPAPGTPDATSGAGDAAAPERGDIFARADAAAERRLRADARRSAEGGSRKSPRTGARRGGAEGPGAPAASASRGEPAAAAPLTALGWVDPAAVGTSSAAGALSTSRLVPVEPPLLPERTRGRGWVGPVIAVGALAFGYVVATAFWPLSNVQPSISDLTVETPIGEEFPVTWPADGTAALAAVDGPGGTIASNDDALPMASITKVITALMIIEREGLRLDEDGGSYAFTYADSQEYWAYLVADESALDVPVDGTLTLRQMLEGVMLGSANNYVDRLVAELWGSQDAWLVDAQAWLEANGLADITVTDPSGIGPTNVATARALIALADRALQDPVLAEIMAEKSVTLPGAGLVENSNPLIDDAGVVGLKTGSLWSTGVQYWNLLAAKDVTVGQTTVRLYSAVVGQPDEEGRETVSRELLASLEEGIQPATAVAADTAVAHIRTEWGAQSTIVTASDAEVLSWQGVAPATTPEYDVELGAGSGDEVGTLTVAGGLNETKVALALTDDVPPPSFWWRLTHPLDLLGLG
ncbi:D-alanyl-D-alanine carboxypeptidase [Microbacterium betulae]|uniref:D-alanyl-D-alanine carboxypeptidase n=1 Tax=Microbacterium betulae TaxID=2981139 RepID=A0AA97I577_9MICO|nr:D-alanyl-D-alanine carboxypeptidase [Microbacterium sp. AB]WOF23416.1 D-alanyl-D-alanine carboxypeptidase [Microbacterium sp. AB]